MRPQEFHNCMVLGGYVLRLHQAVTSPCDTQYHMKYPYKTLAFSKQSLATDCSYQ